MRALSAATGWLLAALRDRGFVVFIICLLTVLYTLGLVVPQRGAVLPETWHAWREQSPRLVSGLERAGLTDVYRAPGTYVALGFFFLSLGAVVVERFPRLWRRTRLDQGIALEADVLARRKGTVEVPASDPAGAVHRAAAFLRAAGYRIHAPEAGAARAVRFRVAPLGFVLFHGAFVLLLAGGLLLDMTRFSGVANVGEGEPFDAAVGEYAERPRVPRVGKDRPDVSFTVVGVHPRSERGFPVSLGVDLLLEGEASPRTANINAPVEVGATSLLVLSAGAAPLFVCEAEGATDGAYVKLVPNATGRTRFFLDPCGLDVLARPYAPEAPEAPQQGAQGVMLGSVGVSRLEAVSQTGIEVAVRGPDGAIARGVLRPGDALATPDGKRVLRMPELRYYARLQIIDERGGALLWAGFLLGTLGLVLRLVLFRREIAIVGDPGRARVLIAAAADVAGWRPDALLAGLSEVLREPAARPRLQA